MPTDKQNPAHKPPPPAKDGKGAGEPPFDDRPQFEDEFLSGLLQKKDKGQPTNDKPPGKQK